MPPFETVKSLQERIALYDDEAAYKELFLSFSLPLRHFAASFIPSGEIAEEIVSDVFIKLWLNRKSLLEVRVLRVYLFQSTRNTALNYIRNNKRFSTLPLSTTHSEIPSTTLNPEQLMINAELTKRINSAISRLPPRCRIIYQLARENGMKYKEIALTLKISVKTIDNQLAIALSKIAQAINFKLEKKVPF